MGRFGGCRGCLSLVVGLLSLVAVVTIASRVPVWQTAVIALLAAAWLAFRRINGSGDTL